MANVVLRVGRYVLYDEIATGGMATVHYGQMLGPSGFTRTVAIKRLHPRYAKDPEFIAMFLDEARLAARVRHPNVVAMLDVVPTEGEVLLVMELVSGTTLSVLLRTLREQREPMPARVAAAVVSAALLGLHAAHEATDEHGTRLGLVHRDVSPQNILVSGDGAVRIADFGIAKAAGRLQTTREGHIKGKAAYMAPEQVRGKDLDRRADVYAAAVVLWEALAGRRLFVGDGPLATMNAVLEAEVPAPSTLRGDVSAELDAIVMRGLARDPAERFASAREMAVALEAAAQTLSARELGEWAERIAGDVIARSDARLREIEATPPSATTSAAEQDGVPQPTDLATASIHVTEIVPHVRRRRWVAAGAAVLALGVVAISVVASRDHGEPRAAPSPVASSPVTRAQEPAASTIVVAPVMTATAPVATALVATRPRSSPRPTSAPTQRCNPPFTVDSAGIKRWKDGC